MQVHAAAKALQDITQFDRSVFTPLSIGGEILGCVNATWCQRLTEHTPNHFALRDGILYALESTSSMIERSNTLATLAAQWRDDGWLNGWRNEKFIAYFADGTPCLEMERAAFRPLGLTSRAVHLNGLTRMDDGSVRMWIGRRSPFKDVAPDRLDNLMGGGIAAGESVQIALEREGWEEAGIPADKLALLPQAALLLAERPVPRGLHREWLYVFDVWLNAKEVPCNQDGEVAEHLLLSLDEVANLIGNGQFMSDAALVAADCLARLGYWDAQHEIQRHLKHIRAPIGSDQAQH